MSESELESEAESATAQRAYSLDFARAYGAPTFTGLLKACPEDFRVTEDLGVEFSGEGEHLYLYIEKRGLNTRQVAKTLAQWAGVKPMDVGYAGMKDKVAVTRQWFSLYLGNRVDPDVDALNEPGLQVLEQVRHRQKLRRGMHRANRFEIRLSQCEGMDELQLNQRMQQVAEGVPNYFGEQRFGFAGDNLTAAQQMLVERKRVGRAMKGIYLSAARSYLFNRVLSARVEQGNWSSSLAGDMLESASGPTGPLWGRGRTVVTAEVAALETEVLAEWGDWRHGLEHQGLKQERRPLVLPPGELDWVVERAAAGHNLTLSFSLPVGGYATSLLREICLYQKPAVER